MLRVLLQFVAILPFKGSGELWGDDKSKPEIGSIVSGVVRNLDGTPADANDAYAYWPEQSADDGESRLHLQVFDLKVLTTNARGEFEIASARSATELYVGVVNKEAWQVLQLCSKIPKGDEQNQQLAKLVFPVSRYESIRT